MGKEAIMAEAMFLSEEWVQAFKESVRNSPSYKEAAKTWEGDITLVVKADSKVGMAEDVYLYMDLWHGDCRDMRLVPKEEGESAKFVISGAVGHGADGCGLTNNITFFVSHIIPYNITHNAA